MPKVSVVIPIHNGKQFLRETWNACSVKHVPIMQLFVWVTAPQMGRFLFSNEYGDRVTIFQNVPAVSIIAEKTDI